MLTVAKAPNVIPLLGTNGAPRLISGVKIHLREEFVVQFLNLTTDQRQQRFALQPGRALDVKQRTNGWIEIQMRYHRVRNPTAIKPARASHDERYACSVHRKVALHGRKRDAVVVGRY